MNKLLFVTTLFFALSSQAQQVLTFDQPSGTTSWLENGINWSMVGGVDNVNISNPRTGSGHGQSVSQNSSYLEADTAINITSIWVKSSTDFSGAIPRIMGYDSLGQLIYTKNIVTSVYQNGGFKQIYNEYLYQELNWEKVWKIKFDIPFNSLPGGFPPDYTPMDFPVSWYFDDMEYEIYAAPVDGNPPSISCFFSSVDSCVTYTVPDLTNQLMVWDDVSPPQNIQIVQSITVDSVLTQDSEITLTATDEAGNSSSCSFLVYIHQSTSSTQNITSTTSYKDGAGNFHYNSKTLDLNLLSSTGCDSTATINLTINQELNVLNFDVEENLTTWKEDNISWSWTGGNDKISNSSSPKRGIGHGVARSGTISKLMFPAEINLQSIWIKFSSSSPFGGSLSGYDENGNFLSSEMIMSTGGYQEFVLNWANVSSVGFYVPYDEMPGMFPGDPPMQFPVNLYYDDLSYAFTTPTINCPESVSLCLPALVPDYSSLISFNGDTTSFDFTQTPTVNTAWSNETEVVFELKNEADEVVSSCTSTLNTYPISVVTIDTANCGSFTSPLGVVYNATSSFTEVLLSSSGCDSTVAINLVINQPISTSLNISLVDSFYVSPLGTKYYESATIVETLTSQYGCDSIVTVNLSVLNTYDKLDFDETVSTTSWMEDGYSWSSSPIVHNQPKSGIGHIEFYGNEWVLDTLIASPSLRAEWQMDVKSIWIKAQDASSISEAYIIGFDENDAKLITKRIPNTYLSSTYKKFDLFWEEIKGIHLVYQYMPDPNPMAPPSNPRIYVDEIEYKMLDDTESPVIACLSDTSLCISAPLPDFTQIASATDNKQIASFTQTPSAGTPITEATLIKLKATDFAGNQDSCSFMVTVTMSSDTTINVNACNSYYISSIGNVFESGTYVDSLTSVFGCDSIVRYNLTLNKVDLPVNIFANQQSVCSNSKITLYASCGMNEVMWANTGTGYYAEYHIRGTEDSLIINVNPDSRIYARCRSTSTSCQGNSVRVLGSDQNPAFTDEPLIQLDFSDPAQIPILTANKTELCLGDSVIITATGCVGEIINWSTGQTGNSIIDDPASSTTYWASCGNSECKSSSVLVDVLNYPSEVPSIVLGMSIDTLCQGQTVLITPTGCSTGYQWLNEELESYHSSFMATLDSTTIFEVACKNNSCLGASVSKSVPVGNPRTPRIIDVQKTETCSGTNYSLTFDACYQGQLIWGTEKNAGYSPVDSASDGSFSIDIQIVAGEEKYLKYGCLRNFCNSEMDSIEVSSPRSIKDISIDKNSFCSGMTATVSFEVSTEANFALNNIFQAYLSNENFTNKRLVGELTSTQGGSIVISIPNGIVTGTNYLLRIEATGHPSTNIEQECYVLNSAITIQSGKDIYINRSTATCENSELLLSAYSSGINLNDYEITWHKDDISINSKDQDTLVSTIYKRIFSKPSDAGLYYVTAYRESDGCLLTSNSYQNNIDSNVFPPIIPDTTIQRGKQLTITSAGCNGYTRWSFRGDYAGFMAFGEGGGENTFDMGIVNTDTTIYVACLDGCFSNIVPVKITVFDPPNAPSPPILSVEHNNSCMYTGITPIVTATGCSGSVRWAYNKNMEYIIEIDNVSPYKFTPPYEFGGTFYADCVENGILSSGQSEIIITRGRADDIAYHTLVPQKVNEVNGYEVNTGSDITISISENDKKNQYHCLNGNIHWFDSASSGSLLSVGDSYTKLNVTSDYEVYSSCVRDGCESPRKKAKVVVASNVNSFELHQSNYAICESGTVTLSVSGCANNNIKWFESENSTTELFTGNNFQTPNLTASAGTNMLTEYWAFCADGVATERKKVNVYVTPPPNTPVVTDSIGTCNSQEGSMFAQGCDPQIEESSWYKNGQPYGYYGGLYLSDRNLWLNRADNWSYRNQTEYNAVSCRNIISGCESPRVPFTFSYDCTPPSPPNIGVANTSPITTSLKDKNTPQNKGISSFNIEICSEEEIIISTPDCTEGAIFWSDGGAGNIRRLNPKKQIVGLTATCTDTKFVKSEESNEININIKPTPKLLVLNPIEVESGNVVNLTNSDMTAGSVFPSGTTLTYYTDSLTSVQLQNPTIITQEGRYFIKAESPNGCFDVEGTTVLINYCNSNILLTSPTDNYVGEIISKKTNKKINASNRITDGSKVNFMGKEAIILSPGFIATSDQGGVFKAIIEGCPE